MIYERCQAEGCENTFLQRTGGKPRQYCSSQCRDREKQRRYRAERLKEGRCPQCGGEMDFPASVHGNKKHPSYCSQCQAYFRERHKEKESERNAQRKESVHIKS